jgi:hypothetical protein
VHNFLGFAYRSDDSSPESVAEYVAKGYAHYHLSLTLNNENCGTWGYLGQLYALQEDEEGAAKSLAALCSLRAAGKCGDAPVDTLTTHLTAAGMDLPCDADADPAALLASLPAPEADISENPMDGYTHVDEKVESSALAVAVGMLWAF